MGNRVYKDAATKTLSKLEMISRPKKKKTGNDYWLKGNNKANRKS